MDAIWDTVTRFVISTAQTLSHYLNQWWLSNVLKYVCETKFWRVKVLTTLVPVTVYLGEHHLQNSIDGFQSSAIISSLSKNLNMPLWLTSVDGCVSSMLNLSAWTTTGNSGKRLYHSPNFRTAFVQLQWRHISVMIFQAAGDSTVCWTACLY